MQTHHTTRLPRPLKNETGKRYGRLTVIEQTPVPERVKEKRQGFWLCRCDCGNTIVTNGSNLRRGDTVSCGCYNRDYEAKQGKKPKRLHHLPEYNIWNHMKRRCHNPNDGNYIHYGARGITVCAEWRDSFEAFYAHVGPRPGPEYTIDRIDVNGNYEPGNVRWTTIAVQNRNRRDSIRLTHDGRTQVISDWAREYGVPVGKATRRYHEGRPWEEIFFPGDFTRRRR